MKLAECYMTFTEALESYLEAREEVQAAPFASRRRQDAVVKMGVAREHLNAMTNLATVADAVHKVPEGTTVSLDQAMGDIYRALRAL